MANIEDITSLSDLLNTSPREPEGAPDPQFDSIEDEPVERETVLVSDDPQLELQKEKVRVNELRDELIKQRADLKEEIEFLRGQTKRLLDQRKQKLTQDRIKQVEAEAESDAASESTVDAESSDEVIKGDEKLIVRLLNVLPSDNWQERLRYAKMFYPFITIRNAQVRSGEGADENSRLINFIVEHSKSMFHVTLAIQISKLDNSLVKIAVPPKNELLALSLISQSVFNVLVKNYIPRLKLNLIMYVLSSLAEILAERVGALERIVNLFKDYVTSTSSLAITFKINPTCSVFFKWDIVLDDTVAGEVESSLKLHVTTIELGSCNATDVLNELVMQSNDVYYAISSFLYNTYQLKPYIE